MKRKPIWVALIMGCMLLLPLPANAASNITVDGNFNDWDGQPSMSDPVDGFHSYEDIIKFSWATNDGDSTLYFMIQRKAWGVFIDWIPVTFYLYLDINDNGRYHDAADHCLSVYYSPSNGLVSVTDYNGKGKILSSYSGYWGQSSGIGTGNKVEFKATMAQLGLYPAQSIRMYVRTSSDWVPSFGDIQWSPIPIMPNWLLAAIFIAGLTGAIIMIRKRRMVC